MPAIVIGKGGFVFSFATEVKLSDYLKGVKAPRKMDTPPGESHKKGLQVTDDALQAHPWLANLLGATKHKDKGGASSSTPGTSSRAPCIDLTDDLIDSAFAQLEEKRAEWRASDDFVATDFETHIRGGRWTAARAGVPFDCIVGRPCTEAARQWIREYGLPSMASYSYRRFGEKTAAILAQAWCHRMQYLLGVYIEHGGGAYHFASADFDAYPEPEGLRELRAAAQTRS